MASRGGPALTPLESPWTKSKQAVPLYRGLFVATSDIRALDNPFYRALNGLLEEQGFDEFAEEQCRERATGAVRGFLPASTSGCSRSRCASSWDAG